jgi:hypothetical protein
VREMALPGHAWCLLARLVAGVLGTVQVGRGRSRMGPSLWCGSGSTIFFVMVVPSVRLCAYYAGSCTCRHVLSREGGCTGAAVTYYRAVGYRSSVQPTVVPQRWAKLGRPADGNSDGALWMVLVAAYEW